MTWEEFSSKAQIFLNGVFDKANSSKFLIPENWFVDHICFRTSTFAEYLEHQTHFSRFGNLLIESEVGGRPISTFKLFEPIVFGDHTIPLVELPAPKLGKPTPLGFEHIEIVCDKPFDKIISEFPDLTFDSSGLAKSFSQELEIDFGGASIKLHHLSLESVIRLESNKNIFNALVESQILTTFKDLNPLVAGTFPLGLSGKDSDLDVLVFSNQLDDLSKRVQNHYRNFKDFSIEVKQKDSQRYLLANFSFGDVPFEIYACDVEPINQRAYRHFLIEERILSMGGVRAYEEVKSLLASGLKTEPAFAKLLGLLDDPYLALLEVQKWSPARLEKLISSNKG
jgi:predicted metalloenzyme YecM